MKRYKNYDQEESLKNILLYLFAFTIAVGCAPQPSQLKKVIEENPDIVFSAIEKDPVKFVEVVNKAVQSAQSKREEGMAAEEDKKRDEEFKNPLKPVIDESRAIWGPKDAPITIVEYSDFECPFCARGYQNLKQVLQAYDGKIRVVFKHLPLDFHPKAEPAAKYFEAVARQDAGKAEKFHDKIFENREELVKSGDKFLDATAKAVGADMAKLKKDLADPKLMDRIKADIAEAQSFGITGTPGFVINGVSLKGAYPASEFKKIIDRHLAQK